MNLFFEFAAHKNIKKALHFILNPLLFDIFKVRNQLTLETQNVQIT